MLDNSIKRVNASNLLNKDKEKIKIKKIRRIPT